jgi:hypothetical protein
MEEAVHRNSRESLSCHSQECGINFETVHKILSVELKVISYRIQIFQALSDPGKIGRLLSFVWTFHVSEPCYYEQHMVYR